MAKRTSAPARLREYQRKRDFTRTPEPTGSARRARKPKDRFFCVQKHLASHLHYDFRLEHAGVLLSWAVPKGPSLNPKDKRLAMRTEDHPFEYGQFEGVIPEGYGAGIVMLWDKGVWVPEPGFEDVDAAMENGELKFRLEGVKLKGSWVLVRTGGGGSRGRGSAGAGSRGGGEAGGRSWLLIKHRDEWAGEIDVLAAAPDSVKSFGDFADILAAENPGVWQSHRPAEGGAAGAMLRQVIEQAAQRKLARERKPPRAGRTKRPPKASRKPKRP